jgi:mannose-6-phosphate isomerase-like protein (cupin superfamily)
MKDTYPMSQREDIAAYVTKDGSLIRELMHPALHNNQQQSLAEATIPVGCKTKLHRHGQSEELYHITTGRGHMTLGDEVFAIEVGDTVCIPPGTAHCVENRGDSELVILCCCAPAYSHADTELLE